MLNKLRKYSVVVKVCFKAEEWENCTRAVLQSDRFQRGRTVWAAKCALTAGSREAGASQL